MKQKKVDNITIILGSFEKFRTYANTLLVEDKENAIIDPGAKYENLQNLAKNYNIKKVFYSHYHVDHARYNSLFAKAQKFAHLLDAPCLESIEQFSKYTGVHEEEFEEESQMIMRQIHGYEETKIDIKFNDKGIFNIGETVVEMVHTPGHTPGHTCVYFPEKKLR